MAGPTGSIAAGKREERKAHNRAKLLAAARKVFARKGLGEATARDIVRETDLATGTFYNYFEDKDDIFRALVEELGEKARPRAAGRAGGRESGGSLEERIEEAYREYFEFALEERELFAVFRRNAGALAAVPGGELWEAGVRDLVARDLPAADLDYLAAAMAGAGFQIATHLIERDPPDVAEAARFCTRLFIGGARALAERG